MSAADAKDSHEFICTTNADYAAWCATFYIPEALDEMGKRSLDGAWAWQEQERRKRAALAALQARIVELEARQVPEGWVAVLSQMTPEQMRAVQMKSEIGSHITSNWSGAYSCFQEFWAVALAAIKPGKKPADPHPDTSKEQP